MQYLSSFVSLISSIIVPQSFTYAVINGRISIFLWLNNIPSYMQNIFFIQSFIDRHLNGFYVLVIVNNSGLNYFFERVISSSLEICSEVGLLDNMIVLFLTFQGSAIMFYISSTILHFHQQCTRVPLAPHSCQIFVFSFCYHQSCHLDNGNSRWCEMILWL